LLDLTRFAACVDRPVRWELGSLARQTFRDRLALLQGFEPQMTPAIY